MRLDIFLYQNGLAESRSRAKEYILSGAVSYQGKRLIKPAMELPEDTLPSSLCIQTDLCKYVSRGGFKIEFAANHFSVSVENKIALDIGASTGGFTDFLLQNGIQKVYAVDVGSAQLAERIRRDPRVTCIENYNARYMSPSDFKDVIQLVTIDVSFISQTQILPRVAEILPLGGEVISLIKPQFEVGKQNIGKRGIVKDEKARQNAVSHVIAFARTLQLHCRGFVPSPITGGDGNIEYLAYFERV